MSSKVLSQARRASGFSVGLLLLPSTGARQKETGFVRCLLRLLYQRVLRKQWQWAIWRRPNGSIAAIVTVSASLTIGTDARQRETAILACSSRVGQDCWRIWLGIRFSKTHTAATVFYSTLTNLCVQRKARCFAWLPVTAFAFPVC